MDQAPDRAAEQRRARRRGRAAGLALDRPDRGSQAGGRPPTERGPAPGARTTRRRAQRPTRRESTPVAPAVRDELDGRPARHRIDPGGPAGRPEGATRRRLSTWWSPGTDPAAHPRGEGRHQLAGTRGPCSRVAARPSVRWKAESSSTAARSEASSGHRHRARRLGSRCVARRRLELGGERRPPAAPATRSRPRAAPRRSGPRSPGPASRRPPTRRPGPARGRPRPPDRPAPARPPGAGQADGPAADDDASRSVHADRSYGGGPFGRRQGAGRSGEACV